MFTRLQATTSKQTITAQFNKLIQCPINEKHTNKHQVIVGGNFNAGLGTRESRPECKDCIGEYGVLHTNIAGDQLIYLLMQTDTQAYTTFFKKKGYVTWYDHRHNCAPCQLNHFLVSKSIHQ